MLDPHGPARLASLAGEPYKLACRYEWDRAKQQFRYHFYRHGKLIGSIANPKQVVRQMLSFIGGNTK